MSVSAVVVNLDGEDMLGACLASIEASLIGAGEEWEVVVVDNGSRDRSGELVRERHPAATLVELGENRGFAAGVNAGLRCAAGDFVLLLNNDATLEPEAAGHLLAAARSAPDVGSVAAQLRFADAAVINSAGLEVDRLGVAYDRLLGTPVRPGAGGPVEVFGASAGAALYRRGMLAELGGFDEGFFLYLEDVDLAWRARMHGWRCLYEPRAVAHHRHSGTSHHGSGFKHFHVGRGRVRLLARNADGGHLRRYAVSIVAYDLLYVAAAAVADRTLAPLRGRLAGLRQWRQARHAAGARRPVELAPVRGARAALARRAVWAVHSGSSSAEEGRRA